jgi:MFS family permease
MRDVGTAQSPTVFETGVPARLDRLPWTRFHTLVVVALGVTWILDGLEVTLAGSVAGALKSSPMLALTDLQVGLSASAYVAGAVLGALLFGWLADRHGRKRLFNITLGLYLLATALTAFSWSFQSFAIFRFLTGAGIGGEYTAINSAIQELIPARYRGRVDLIINGSFWVGAALGALGAVLLLSPGLLPVDMGWRSAFGIGAALGLVILYLRRYLPESPRWLMTHGQIAAAEAIVDRIEDQAGVSHPVDAIQRIRLQRRSVRLRDVVRTLLRTYPARSFLGLVLMSTQAFFYNAIFFTYALVLGKFFGVPDHRVGLYILPFAAGNFLGPLLLGHMFDLIGRRPMIIVTYAASGILLAITAALFNAGLLTAAGQTTAWCAVFFFASAAASSAYLTVGEIFPLEIRALAIAIFYAVGTGAGGVAGPWLFGALIGTGQRHLIAIGYLVGSVLMLSAAALTFRLGVAAERRALEDVAAPLSRAD